MINVKQFRIGNYLLFGNDFVIVKSIFISHFNCEKLDGISIGNSLQNNFSPITLTPELLQQCGLVKSKLTFTGDDGYIIRNGESYYIGLRQDLNGWSFHNPHFNLQIEHLHQLQNLYFSLTGEELEIMLNNEREVHGSATSKGAALSAEQILGKYKPNNEYPMYYHESHIIAAMEEYHNQFNK